MEFGRAWTLATHGLWQHARFGDAWTWAKHRAFGKARTLAKHRRWQGKICCCMLLYAAVCNCML
eukprot:3859524-Lingulodinium_polyedra.AAC.1